MKHLRILHLEDSALDAELIAETLRRDGLEFTIRRAVDKVSFSQRLGEDHFDVILADYNLVDFTGLEALRILRVSDSDTPLIFVSGLLGEELAIELLKESATDYVFKHKLARLVPAMMRAIDDAHQRTERARILTALQESGARFRFLAESMPQIVWTASPTGDLEYCNHHYLEYTGLPSHKLQGWTWTSTIHEAELERTVESWRKALASGEQFEIAYRIRNHQNAYRWHLARAVPMRDLKQEIVMWVGTNTDIDDQKRAVAAAESASQAKDYFLATLSHELRTPLNAIVGWSDLMKTGRLDAEGAAEALEVIDRNAHTLAKLIDDLLDVSRIISGKLRLDMRDVDLLKIVDAVLQSIQPSALAKNITLRSKLESPSGRLVGDESRLQQAIWNLLSNAVKFTPDGGSVDVRLEQRGFLARLTVCDDGTGIEPADLPHIFEPFRQGEKSPMTRRHGGLGLGLPIVRQLIEMHGGRVTANSAGPGGGSEFTISLPVLSPQKQDNSEVNCLQESDELASNGSTQLRGIKILIVEDEPDARHLLQTVLKLHGAHVVAAKSAKEGLARIDDAMPDILISDIAMPDEDGFSLIAKIRRTLSAEQLPALAFTAFAHEQDRRRMLEAGFQGHLPKPIDPESLILKVLELA